MFVAILSFLLGIVSACAYFAMKYGACKPACLCGCGGEDDDLFDDDDACSCQSCAEPSAASPASEKPDDNHPSAMNYDLP